MGAQLAQESFYGEKESQLLFGLRFELFFNQLHFRMHVLNRIPVFAQVTTGKVTASL